MRIVLPVLGGRQHFQGQDPLLSQALQWTTEA